MRDDERRRAVAKTAVDCLHCGTPGGEPLWTGVEHEYDNTTADEFTFVRCGECGLVRLDPRPDVSELEQIYPPDYYAYGLLEQVSDAKPSFMDRFRMRYQDKRITALIDRLGSEGTVRILDVGCADGRYLDWYKASSIGERLETHGIDINVDAVEIARRRGHEARVGRFETDSTLAPGSFDLVTASHVVEHVDDPRGFVARAAELLRPGGLLVLATPNIDSVEVRRFRRWWGGNHWPRHWTLYDADSMRWLAEHSGLELENVEYQPNPVFWVWTLHSWTSGRFPRRRWPDRLFPTVKIFHASLQSLMLQVPFTVLDVVLRSVTGRTGTMSVELRKPRI